MLFQLKIDEILIAIFQDSVNHVNPYEVGFTAFILAKETILLYTMLILK